MQHNSPDRIGGQYQLGREISNLNQLQAQESESFDLSETEWEKTKQFNPCIAFWFAVLTGLIVVVNSYHDKIMIDYEHQNSFEAAYIINLLTLVCFVILLSVRQCKKG